MTPRGLRARSGTPDELARAAVRSRRICRSPVLPAPARFSATAATVQPARLAFGLRAVLLAARRALSTEDSEAPRGPAVRGGVRVRVRGGLRAGARRDPRRGLAHAELAPGSARELSAASSHIVLTEPVPDVLERVGWTGGEALADCRRMLHYFRTTNDAADRLRLGRRKGRLRRALRQPHGARRRRSSGRPPRRSTRFFPLLADREITHAWGGPIDVAPRKLPIYRSRGALHAGWGFTGHGVGPSHLGGRILSGLALGARDEFTTLPLVEPPVKHFPPEPARYLGGSLIRRALVRKDALDDHGARVGPVTGAIARLPKLLGLNLPR